MMQNTQLCAELRDRQSFMSKPADRDQCERPLCSFITSQGLTRGVGLILMITAAAQSSCPVFLSRSSVQSDDLHQRRRGARREERPPLSCDWFLSCSCEGLLDEERSERDRRNQHQRSSPQQRRFLQTDVQTGVHPTAGRRLQLHSETSVPAATTDQNLG